MVRALRCLQDQRRCVPQFQWQETPMSLVVTTHSDWAGCRLANQIQKRDCADTVVASRLQRNVAFELKGNRIDHASRTSARSRAAHLA